MGGLGYVGAMRKWLEKMAFTGVAKPLLWLTGNRPMQGLLDLRLHVTQHLMGIGAGSNVWTSGERVLVKELRQVDEHPLTVFDVGANSGEFTLMLQQGLRDRSTDLHLFEPAQHTFTLLSQQVTPSEALHMNRLALGAEAGEVALYYDEAGSGLASMTQRDMSHEHRAFDKSETITVSTVDAYCAEHSVSRIDLLKLDVEGREMDVLKGAMRMFSEQSIQMVSFEFGAPNIDTRTFFRDLYYFFRDQRMDVYRLTRSGFLVPIPAYHEKHEIFRTTNFLAKRK